jgi:hypothetical protein
MVNYKVSKNNDSNSLDEGQKWIISLYCVILFLIIASPFMYKLTNSLTTLLGWETSVDGCPNLAGLILHAVVFGLLVRVLMLIPKANV